MSQPRRRRRRGRRGGRGGQPQAQSKKEAVRESAGGPAGSEKGQARAKSSRRRRGRGRSGGRQSASPKSSEDLVRALPKERPETLTAPPDGQTLEAVIGDLQSTWGVPQYPQEYRIVLKVAEEREARGDQGDGQASKRASSEAGSAREKPADAGADGQPRREKAPAAPGMSSSGQREKAPRKRRRRRRRGGKGGPRPGDDSSGGGTGSAEGSS